MICKKQELNRANFDLHTVKKCLTCRFGTFIFRHGEHFYHFQGLREFKEKLDPVWKSRYLVLPGGLALPRVLFDVATLILKGRGVNIAGLGR